MKPIDYTIQNDLQDRPIYEIPVYWKIMHVSGFLVSSMTGLSPPKNMMVPGLTMSIVLTIVSLISCIHVEQGIYSFCHNFEERFYQSRDDSSHPVTEKSCLFVRKLFIKNQPIEHDIYYLTMALIIITMQTGSWAFNTLLILFRCCCFVDFEMVHIIEAKFNDIEFFENVFLKSLPESTTTYVEPQKRVSFLSPESLSEEQSHFLELKRRRLTKSKSIGAIYIKDDLTKVVNNSVPSVPTKIDSVKKNLSSQEITVDEDTETVPTKTDLGQSRTDLSSEEITSVEDKAVVPTRTGLGQSRTELPSEEISIVEDKKTDLGHSQTQLSSEKITTIEDKEAIQTRTDLGQSRTELSSEKITIVEEKEAVPTKTDEGQKESRTSVHFSTDETSVTEKSQGSSSMEDSREKKFIKITAGEEDDQKHIQTSDRRQDEEREKEEENAGQPPDNVSSGSN